MTPLVMVHGFMGGAAQWDGQIAALAATSDVIALDLPGFGANNHLAPITTISGFADWVIAELQQRGVTRFHLLGHSMGGMIAQEIARKVPSQIGQLVLYATGAIGVLPGRFETIAQSKARAKTDGPKATARRIAATWFGDGAAAPAYPACAAIAERATAAAIAGGLDAMQSWSGETALPALPHDTLIIWGDRDRTYQWAQIALLWDNIPNSQLSVLPGCAHAAHLEKPALFNMVLRDHLAIR
ncbi:alpha/beta fold hydrolase [Yoonia sp. SS1-5]|uniref:Alpha/beta fold hydrolase n=1 Tax=Yoonia rhodophyticola TaxID=3137370 RepID=A0AAN0NK19_9RHOB